MQSLRCEWQTVLDHPVCWSSDSMSATYARLEVSRMLLLSCCFHVSCYDWIFEAGGTPQRRWFYLATKSVVLGRTVLRLIVLLECGGAMEFVVKTELRPSQAHTQTHVRLSPSQTGHRQTECCNRWVLLHPLYLGFWQGSRKKKMQRLKNIVS